MSARGWRQTVALILAVAALPTALAVAQPAPKYDFGGALLPFKVPGLSVQLLYAQGRDREDPATGSSLPTTHEGNLDVICNVPQVKGLSLRFRNAYVGRGNDSVVRDYRIIINYELDLL
jgi:hypothetical protein